MSYRTPSLTEAEYHLLLKIKENDGYLGQLPPEKRKLIVAYATVEVMPSGLDGQWTLTAEAKKAMSAFRSRQRYNAKYKGRWESQRPTYQPPKEAPLTIEVLDALKSILKEGHPGTDKMEILAAIQLGSRYSDSYVHRGDGYTYVYGLALYHEGKWLLSNRARELAKNHIRKSECAQFSGKVR